MADGSPVVQGAAAAVVNNNVSGSGTLLSCSSANSISLSVDHQNQGTAVYATGRGVGGAGVIALSEQDYGVYGYASGRQYGVAVQGVALGTEGFAVRGYALQNIAVSGETSTRGSIGVKGESGIGVWGTSPRSFGIGVEGDATADNSIGVYGSCGGSRGIGVYATAPFADSLALQVNGRLGLSNSGLLQIAAGATSATQAGVTLSTSSMVLATLQVSLPGVLIQAAVPDAAAGTVTVHLSQAPAQPVDVAWMVVN